MDKKELLKKLENYKSDLSSIGESICIENKKSRYDELNNIMNSDGFWEDTSKVKEISGEIKLLREDISLYDELSDMLDLFFMMLDENIDEVISELDSFDEKFNMLKLKSLLSGEFDSHNAYVEIHSGAGGTESNDWADMIFRMYTRFFEKNDYTYEILSVQNGEEVGIKGATILVRGYFPFGYLKGETGVHRLVRISPFDSNKRRHTSFASVLVTPEISNDFNIEIKESELKIDVYRSSGAGGQSVNTTDSAVRITHLPTGVVVTCQNERSQIKNKEKALELLKNKLYILNEEKFNETLKSLKGDVMDVNFGSAVRSYVMCPYTLVKDNRSNYETANVLKVLDGDIKEFLEAGLKKQ